MSIYIYFVALFVAATSEFTTNSFEFTIECQPQYNQSYYDDYYNNAFYYYFYIFSNFNGTCAVSGASLNCNCIPVKIPLNITHASLKCAQLGCFTLLSDHFDRFSWISLKILHLEDWEGIGDYGLENMPNLEELYISGFNFKALYKNAFVGLDKLKVLSFKSCALANLDKFASSMSSNFVLPNLERFSMNDMVLQREDIKFSCPEFVKVLLNRSLEEIRMNFIHIDELSFLPCILFSNITGKVDMSFSTFYRTGLHRALSNYRFLLSHVDPFYTYIEILAFFGAKLSTGMDGLKTFDASYTSLPMIHRFIRHIHTLQNETVTLLPEITTLVSRADTVNISGVNQRLIVLKKLSININQRYLRSHTKELILKGNHLHFLDVIFMCKNSTLEKLDLSANVMEFINPRICSCCTALLEINLSNNRLSKMADNNLSMFGQIISSYINLKSVQLSLNKLTELPSEIFHENLHLEHIDLSDNLLTLFTLNVRHLLYLKTVNLKNNKLQMIDHTSFANLQSLKTPNASQMPSSGILRIDDNRFTCSECSDIPFMKWLASTPLIDRNGDIIFCKSSKGIDVPADHRTIVELQEECDKPKRIRNVIIVSSTIPIAIITLIVIAMCVLRSYLRRRLRRKNIADKIDLIRLNQLETRFVVFLSYSSEDIDFMNEYVYNPLNIHLKEKIQTDRDIICLGDRHFQLGKPVNDEMVLTLQQSAVVLLLLSRNFCRSEFCRMEFDHALFMKKPFILMVKEEVDLKDMVPSLQEVFKRNTRLLWEKDDGEFIMKTTWENVISSILDLV